jgi:beta-mannosidase
VESKSLLHAKARTRLGPRIAVGLAWACLLLANLAWGVSASPRTMISLDGDGWTLAGCAFGEGEQHGLQLQATSNIRSIAIAVPNDVQMSAFVKDPLEQSPKLVEVNNKEWWYTRQFPSPRIGPNRQVRLVFDGVDYFADVWLNGVKLGSHEGAYTRFEFDVTDRLSENGSNYLAVRVTAPWKVPGRSHYEFMKGEFDEWWDALPGPGQVIFPLGLHRSVRLEATSYSRISAVDVWTTGLKGSDAELREASRLDQARAEKDGPGQSCREQRYTQGDTDPRLD